LYYIVILESFDIFIYPDFGLRERREGSLEIWIEVPNFSCDLGGLMDGAAIGGTSSALII